jgi:hypothetical protein
MQKRKNVVGTWKLTRAWRMKESSNKWRLVMWSTSLCEYLLVGAFTTSDIPKDWTHIAPDAMTVDDGHHSSWEYSRKEVRGQMFYDKFYL